MIQTPDNTGVFFLYRMVDNKNVSNRLGSVFVLNGGYLLCAEQVNYIVIVVLYSVRHSSRLYCHES